MYSAPLELSDVLEGMEYRMYLCSEYLYFEYLHLPELMIGE